MAKPKKELPLAGYTYTYGGSEIVVSGDYAFIPGYGLEVYYIRNKSNPIFVDIDISVNT